MSEQFTRFLASTELLRDLSLPDLALLEGHLESVSLQSGDQLIQQGEPGDCFYILQYGELQIRLTDDEGSEIVLSNVNPGKSVGEISLLTGERRSASVFATNDATVLRFNQSDFERLRLQAPDITAHFTNIIVNRLQKAELQNLLHASDQFNDLDKSALSDLEMELEPVLCPSGKYLFHEGEDSDCMYIVVSGRLQVADQNGKRILLELGRGQTVGEMAIITGAKRSASVYGKRDSLLAKLSLEGFNRLLQAHPEAITRQFAGKIINRLWLQTTDKPRKQCNVVCIAIVPTSREVQLTDFCVRLSKALLTQGSTLHLNSKLLDEYLSPKGIAQIALDDPNSVNISRWLNKQESNYRYILYQTDPVPSEWTERCLRQADRLLVVGQSNLSSELGEIEAGLLRLPRYRSLPTSLALVHGMSDDNYQRTCEWTTIRDIDQHYQVFHNLPESMLRLARLLTGNGIGVVFGGGGARGFAHIGGLKALREFGIPIDKVGGTSMGAIIAGMAALEWDYDTMLREASAFNYKLDYTFPAVALTSGANITGGLRRGFGERRIEDSIVNFFCVSTNLGRSAQEVHTKGLMWKNIRASASIPGVFPPVVDGDRLLVDGGMVNNLPVDVMQAFDDIGITLALDVSGPVSVNTKVDMDGYFSGWRVFAHWLNPANKLKGLPRLASTLMHASLTRSAETTLQTKNLADYHFRYPVTEYGLLEFHKLQDIAMTGYRYMKEKVSELTNEPSFDLHRRNLSQLE